MFKSQGGGIKLGKKKYIGERNIIKNVKLLRRYRDGIQHTVLEIVNIFIFF